MFVKLNIWRTREERKEGVSTFKIFLKISKLFQEGVIQGDNGI